MRSHLATVALAGLCGGMASAQEIITYSIELSDPILAPGESTKVSVWATLSPGIGGPAVWNNPNGPPEPGTVEAFGATGFAVFGTEPGLWDNLSLNPNFSTNYPGDVTPDGVINIGASQFALAGLLKDNPIYLWSATWTPDAYHEGSVTIYTSIELALVWLNVEGWAVPVGDFWGSESLSAEVTIIPAPSAAALMGIAAVGYLRRRRSSTVASPR